MLIVQITMEASAVFVKLDIPAMASIHALTLMSVVLEHICAVIMPFVPIQLAVMTVIVSSVTEVTEEHVLTLTNVQKILITARVTI